MKYYNQHPSFRTQMHFLSDTNMPRQDNLFR